MIMFKFGSIPLKIRLPIVIVGIALLMSLIVGTVGYVKLVDLAQRNTTTTMEGVLASRKDAVQGLYKQIAQNLDDMASGQTGLAAIRRLSLGWKSAGSDPAAKLTEIYITANPNPPGQRMQMDKGDDPITYNQQHLTFHPAFRNWIALRGYYDFFLIDLDGNVIYTVAKESDFASNLLTGPDANGPLAAVFKAAKDDPDAVTHYSDFGKYGPSAGAPAAFAAKTIRAEDGTAIGVVAVQLSEATLQSVVDNPSNLGKTGEVVIVAQDGTTRSTSRFDGGFKLLDALPPSATKVEPTGAMYENATLISGESGSVIAGKLDVPGLDYTLMIQMADSESYAEVHDAIVVLVLWTIGTCVAVAAVGLLIARSITSPINRIVGSVKAIAEGQLEAEVADADRNDEVGNIAKSLDALRQKLAVAASMEAERERLSEAQRSVVDGLTIGLNRLSEGNLAQSIEEEFGAEYELLRTNFNETVEKLHETITIVVDTAESIRSRSREISQSSEDLSRRTENQAATLEETAAALDELTSSIRSAAESAKEVEVIVRSARSEAEESGKVVQGAVTAMTEIEHSSEQISQIIGVIDDIAFQTNLLALNAGVEAARAGDAGKGFAVVASEVRALAQRSSAAAREIKTLISASTQHVGRGVEQVGRAGTVLENIVSRVTHISTLVSSIASAAVKQSTGLAEINLGVTQLDQVTQQNAAMVEESTAASQSLNQEASGLSELVSQFRVRNSRKPAPAVIEFPSISPVFDPEPVQEYEDLTPEPVHQAPPPPPAQSAMVGGAGTWQDF